MLRWFKLPLILLIAAASQAQTPDTVIAGPDGVPRLVRTEGGQWSEPVQVFSDANEVVYVPDITTPGWAQWHEQDFKEHGLYFTYVYTYWRKRRVTVRELIYVNTRTQQIRVEPFLKPPLQINLHTSTPTISKTVANITKLVQDSIANFRGPSLQDDMRNKIANTEQPQCYAGKSAGGAKHSYCTTSPLDKPRLSSVSV